MKPTTTRKATDFSDFPETVERNYVLVSRRQPLFSDAGTEAKFILFPVQNARRRRSVVFRSSFKARRTFRTLGFRASPDSTTDRRVETDRVTVHTM